MNSTEHMQNTSTKAFSGKNFYTFVSSILRELLNISFVIKIIRLHVSFDKSRNVGGED